MERQRRRFSGDGAILERGGSSDHRQSPGGPNSPITNVRGHAALEEGDHYDVRHRETEGSVPKSKSLSDWNPGGGAAADGVLSRPGTTNNSNV